MPVSQNRTKWPITGGAVGAQPGWFPGHSSAFFYINLGEGTIPLNYSLPMQPVFQILGPSNQQYDGSWCLPQVPLPANFTAKVGDNATIQVIETAQHGAALYNVSIQPNFKASFRSSELTWKIDSASISPSQTPQRSQKSTRQTVPTAQISASNLFSAPTPPPRPPPVFRSHRTQHRGSRQYRSSQRLLGVSLRDEGAKHLPSIPISYVGLYHDWEVMASTEWVASAAECCSTACLCIVYISSLYLP